jgi:hypothetical protein
MLSFRKLVGQWQGSHEFLVTPLFVDNEQLNIVLQCFILTNTIDHSKLPATLILDDGFF